MASCSYDGLKREKRKLKLIFLTDESASKERWQELDAQKWGDRADFGLKTVSLGYVITRARISAGTAQL